MGRLVAMIRARILALSLITLLALPGAVQARSIGISVGDTIVYNYTIYTSYATPNGNHTTSQFNQFSILVTSVDTTKPLGEVGYTESILILNGSSVTTGSPVSNVTTILDPYDNNTYLGNIGFYPFVYTDVAAGSAYNLNISLPVVATAGTTLYGVQHLNATVAREKDSIGVNFTVLAGKNIPPSYTVMKFDASSGVLISGETFTHLFGIEKNFSYALVSYSHVQPSDLSIFLYAIPVVVAVIAVVLFLSRPSRRQRKKARMREKFGR